MSFITRKTIYTKLCNLASTCSIPFPLSSSQLHIFCRRCVQLLLVILSSHSHYIHIHIHIYANILSALVFLLHFFLLLFHRIQPAFLVVFHSFNQFDPFHLNFVFFILKTLYARKIFVKLLTRLMCRQRHVSTNHGGMNQYHATPNTPNARVFKHFKLTLLSKGKTAVNRILSAVNG